MPTEMIIFQIFNTLLFLLMVGVILYFITTMLKVLFKLNKALDIWLVEHDKTKRVLSNEISKKD